MACFIDILVFICFIFDTIVDLYAILLSDKYIEKNAFSHPFG